MCCCYSKFRQIPNWFSVFLSSSILASSSCISLCYQVDSGVNVTFLDSQYLRYPVTKIFAKTEFVPFLNKLIPGPGWHTPTKVPWLWLIRRFPRLFSFKIALRSQPVSPASSSPNIRHQVIVLQSALVARSNSSLVAKHERVSLLQRVYMRIQSPSLTLTDPADLRGIYFSLNPSVWKLDCETQLPS